MPTELVSFNTKSLTLAENMTSILLPPITQEPKKQFFSNELNEGEDLKLRGLSSLAVANFIHIKVKKSCLKCDFKAHYDIINNETNATIFKSSEDNNCCNYCSYGNNLNNIILRDMEKRPVARVCYKEKSVCINKLVMGIYAPADLLVATVEESQNCFNSSRDFEIRDADGTVIFFVEFKYNKAYNFWCSNKAYFKVKSADKKLEVAKILEKTSIDLKLEFKTKLDITAKVILTGFCIGLVMRITETIISATIIENID